MALSVNIPVAGLDPATHVFSRHTEKDVDPRVKPAGGATLAT
jgi:hypothetical protein